MADSHIKPLKELSTDWSAEHRTDSLMAVRRLVSEKLDKAIEWYRAKGRCKNKAAFVLRILAISLGALAAAWPTVTKMVARTDSTNPWWARLGLVTILAVLVGALILLYKLLGASSGWIPTPRQQRGQRSLRQ